MRPEPWPTETSQLSTNHSRRHSTIIRAFRIPLQRGDAHNEQPFPDPGLPITIQSTPSHFQPPIRRYQQERTLAAKRKAVTAAQGPSIDRTSRGGPPANSMPKTSQKGRRRQPQPVMTNHILLPTTTISVNSRGQMSGVRALPRTDRLATLTSPLPTSGGTTRFPMRPRSDDTGCQLNELSQSISPKTKKCPNRRLHPNRFDQDRDISHSSSHHNFRNISSTNSFRQLTNTKIRPNTKPKTVSPPQCRHLKPPTRPSSNPGLQPCPSARNCHEHSHKS